MSETLTDIFTTTIIILVSLLINVIIFEPSLLVMSHFKGTIYENLSNFFLKIEEEINKRKNQTQPEPKPKNLEIQPEIQPTPEIEIKTFKPKDFDKTTQVSEIDFETYDIRSHLKLSKMNSSFSLKNFMNLPSDLRSDNHLRIERMKFDEINKIFNTNMKDASVQTFVETREIGIGSEMHQSINIEKDHKNVVIDSPLPNLPFELIEHPLEEMVEKQEMKKKKKLKKLDAILKKENENKKSKDMINPNGFELRCFDSDFVSGFEISNNHSKLIQFLIEEDFYQIGDEVIKRGRDEKSPILYLSSMKMISLPLYLIEENIITHLDLSNNYLTNLPNWFFDSMKNLTHLDLSRNYLNQLPEKFQELKKLKDLYLSYNQFEFFPPSILNLPSLQFLNFDNNLLIHIPNDIIKLRYTLYELDISNNKLIDLPDDLKIAKKLKLKATGNRFLYYTNFEIIPKLLSFDDNKLTPTSIKRYKNQF
jgi:hypothetical protein